MKLPFLDRERERERIERTLRRRETTCICLYGRRRLGKSRLLREALRGRPAVYFVADERDAPLQRAALAREAAAVLPGFDRVRYPDWDALLRRWWAEAPPGACLALDEFPQLVARAPELPGLLQQLLDRESRPARHLLLCGSSQRMMHGLVLDASAPLYGRAREILRIGPLDLASLRTAFRSRSAADSVEHWAVWGGVPRYWELALDHPTRDAAVEDLLLDPLGVLHHEPERILRDDLQETVRAASILVVVGQGAHRVSEIGARLGMPATSLTRPLARLLDIGLLTREVPFGASFKDTKRTAYRIGDPLLRFWYRFVDPNRSRLEAGQVRLVAAEVRRAWPQYLGQAWEEVVRENVARTRLFGASWLPAGRWWGPGRDGRPLELDVVSRRVDDPDTFLLGEVKTSCTAGEAQALLARLEDQQSRCPVLAGKRVRLALFVLRPAGRWRDERVVTAEAFVGTR